MHPEDTLSYHSLRGATAFPPRSDIVLTAERQSSLRGEKIVLFVLGNNITVVHPHDN